jgi:hypothetical protein
VIFFGRFVRPIDEKEIADLNAIVVVERDAAFSLLSVDEGAVSALLVLDQVAVSFFENMGVKSAGGGNVDLDFAVGVAADPGDRMDERVLRTGGFPVENLQGRGHAFTHWDSSSGNRKQSRHCSFIRKRPQVSICYQKAASGRILRLPLPNAEIA